MVISEEVLWLRLKGRHCNTSKPNPWHLYPLIFIDMTVRGSSPAFSTLKLFLMAKSGLLVRRPVSDRKRSSTMSSFFCLISLFRVRTHPSPAMYWYWVLNLISPSRHSIRVDWGTLKRREAPGPGSLPPTFSSSLAPWPCTIIMSNTVRLFLKCSEKTKTVFDRVKIVLNMIQTGFWNNINSVSDKTMKSFANLFFGTLHLIKINIYLYIIE